MSRSTTPRYVPKDRDVGRAVPPLSVSTYDVRELAQPGPSVRAMFDDSQPSGPAALRPVALPSEDEHDEGACVSQGEAEVPWTELMREHGRRVIVSLVGRGIAMERAQELAQEAWLRIISQHRAGRLQRLEMPGIVVAQANFLARDEHRRRGRRARMGLSTLADPGAEVADLANAVAGPDLERRVSARQSLRRVLQVVDRAYPNAQRVFHLLYGADPLTPSEAASATGLSVQRVRQILCELRKAIRDELEPTTSGAPAQ